jgi:hypothetical protein
MKSQQCVAIILSLNAGLFAVGSAKASTIAAAKAMPLGSVVTLNNVIIGNTTDLVNSSVSASFIVQDSTGGSNIFGSNADIAALLTGLSAGDRINVTGTTASFSGLFQLIQPSLVTSLVTAAVGVPAPVVTTTADYQDFSPTAESLESKLVSLANVHFTGIVPGQTFAGATNYTVTDGVKNATVRIQTTNISLVGDSIPTGQVNISGVFSQFDSGNPVPGVAGIGYQLYPLDDSSITLVPEPGTCILASMVAAVTALTVRTRQPRGGRRLRRRGRPATL